MIKTVIIKCNSFLSIVEDVSCRYYRTLSILTSAIYKDQNEGQSGCNVCFLRLTVQRKIRTTTRLMKRLLGMLTTPRKALLNTCSWAAKCLTIRSVEGNQIVESMLAWLIWLLSFSALPLSPNTYYIFPSHVICT